MVFFYRVSPSCFSKKSPLYISFLPFIFLLLLLHSYHFLHLTCFLLQHKFRHELSLYSWAVPLGSSSLNIMINGDFWGSLSYSNQLSNIKCKMYQTNYCKSIKKLQKASSDNPVSSEIIPQKVGKHVDFACSMQIFTSDGVHSNLPLDP